jgi:type IV pilus assembly protein PilA
MNKKNGFTLIELLSVIVILAIILVIAIPNIMKVIDKAKTDTYLRNETLLINATRNYLAGNSDKAPANIGDIAVIDISELQSNNLIDNIKDIKSNTNCTGKVIITKKSANEYAYNPYLDCGTNYKTYDDYVSSGLVLNLDGYDAPQLISSKNYWVDKSGNNNNMQMINMANTATSGYDANKKGYVFDGTNDYMSGNISDAFTNTAITIEYITNFNDIIYKYASSVFMFNNWDVVLGLPTGIAHRIISQSEMRSSIIIPQQTGMSTYREYNYSTYNYKTLPGFTKVTITYENGTIKWYHNGNLVITNNIPEAQYIKFAPATLRLGTWGNGANSSNVTIKKFSIYNRALTSAEILNNYNIDKQRFGL